jgi:fructose PTS system EIIBC or EIIC component
MIPALQKLRQHLLTGVSFAIPFIACGGILIAFGIAFVPMTPSGPDFSGSPVMKLVLDIGAASFALLLPILAGYIAYAMAGKPGLVPGFVGGYLAGEVKAGFLGALLIGLIAGWIVNGIKKLQVPSWLRPIMPILVIPIVSSLAVGVLMLKVLGVPIADLMTSLGNGLKGLSEGNAVTLAAVLGAMIAFDMGGPVNKAAFFFGAAMIKEGQYGVMGACAAAICTPPLGMGLATLIQRHRWSDEEREAGIAALAMGMIGITEGAIPFAAADPLRVIPCIMLGSMVAATIAMLGGVGDHAPHGGPIVLPVVDRRLVYVVAIVAGTAVTALGVHALRRLTRGGPATAGHGSTAPAAEAPPGSAVPAVDAPPGTAAPPEEVRS